MCVCRRSGVDYAKLVGKTATNGRPVFDTFTNPLKKNQLIRTNRHFDKEEMLVFGLRRETRRVCVAKDRDASTQYRWMSRLDEPPTASAAWYTIGIGGMHTYVNWGQRPRSGAFIHHCIVFCLSTLDKSPTVAKGWFGSVLWVRVRWISQA